MTDELRAVRCAMYAARCAVDGMRCAVCDAEAGAAGALATEEAANDNARVRRQLET